MSVLKLLVLFLTCVTFTCGLKILGIFHHPGKSHFDVFKPILVGLANKGHQLTVISHFPLKKPINGYKDISLANTTRALLDVIDMDTFQGYRYEKYGTVVFLTKFAYDACEAGLSSKPVQDLIKSQEKFDLIIAEYFNTDCFIGFAHKYKVPIISLSSCTIMPWMNERFGNPDHPAYIPNNLMDYSDRLTFFERVENTLVGLFQRMYYDFVTDRQANALARKYFGQDLPNLRDIVSNTSLMIVNTHFSLNLPRPNVPSVIEIGGIHIGEIKKLPSVSSYTYLIEYIVNLPYILLIHFLKTNSIPQSTTAKNVSLTYILILYMYTGCP